VFGELDAVFFTAFDDASVLEIDAPLDGRGGVYWIVRTLRSVNSVMRKIRMFMA